MNDKDTYGAIDTGAYGALEPWSKEATLHAERYYNAVRAMKSDYIKIAENTGFTAEEIKSIKDFIFYEEHDLSDGYERFAPSYEMAQSWQRLIDGKDIKPHDITMLKHEILEKELITQGLSQTEAHIEASKIYNYTAELEDFQNDNHQKH
jgi:hypothetical protein